MAAESPSCAVNVGVQVGLGFFGLFFSWRSQTENRVQMIPSRIDSIVA